MTGRGYLATTSDFIDEIAAMSRDLGATMTPNGHRQLLGTAPALSARARHWS